MRYLTHTSHIGITYGRDTTCTTFHVGPAYCDANWGGLPGSDRKSTSGYLVKLNGGVVTWSSKKQPVVSTSTAEAEYMAAGALSQEVM